MTGFRWIWDLSFAGGSLIATFVQGMTVGALVEGLPMKDGHYIGGTFGWFSPFATLCGLGLVLGYSLLGASWLVRKCEGPIRERAYQLLPVLTVAVLAFLATALVLALSMHLGLMGRWLERPYLLIFPLVGAVSSIALLKSVERRDDLAPFRFSALIFMAAFGTLAGSFWPYMIPFCTDGDTGGIAGGEPVLHAVGSRPFRDAAHPDLYACCLSAIPWAGGAEPSYE